MRERPILFSGEMVRAILDGRKTQTRRVVSDPTSQGNYRASELLLDDSRVFADPGPSPAGNPGWYLHAPVNCEAICSRRGWSADDCDPSVVDRLYPRWFAGDRLWVRETWHCPRQLGGSYQREKLIFRADAERLRPAPDHSDVLWAPSIFMPRWASRITLEVTGVRVERLQEISEADALAEGCQPGEPLNEVDLEMMRGTEEYELAKALGIGSRMSAKFAYLCLWDDLNEKRGYGWSTNPWVWVIEFRRVP
jgi:hypothetical protein